eukprot:Em0006g763a
MTDINIVLYGMDSTADIMYTVLSGPYCVDPTADIGLDHTHCSNIKIQPARNDLRDKCDQMLVTLRHSLSDEQRKTINDKYTQHLIKAKAFRDAYNANIEEAEKEWGRKRQKEHEQILGHLESSALMSPFTSHAHLDMQMQYSFDYCQHVTPRKVQVFGVCCEPLSRQVFFLIDEAEQAGKGAVVMLNFMLPGHTKFRPNSYFGLFKKYYRRQDHVSDMDDLHLADCVRQCGQDVTCVPQLYQDWHYYDWNAFLGQWFSPLAGLGRCYTFRFDRKHPGVMKMKTLSSDTNPTEVRAGVAITDIKDAYQSQVMLPVITPSGLSLTRYLYERVREYFRDPPKRDKVCPKPPPGSGPDSGNASSLPESNQPGPSTAIPHSPTVEGHDFAEDTYSEVQDGEDGCVSGRIKRRPRSELILAYQCTVCGKRYASGPALSLHKKNTH